MGVKLHFLYYDAITDTSFSHACRRTWGSVCGVWGRPEPSDPTLAAGRFTAGTFIYSSDKDPPATYLDLAWQRGMNYATTEVVLGTKDALRFTWQGGVNEFSIVGIASLEAYTKCAISEATAFWLEAKPEPSEGNHGQTQLLVTARSLGVGDHYLSAISVDDCAAGMRLHITVTNSTQAAMDEVAQSSPVAYKKRQRQWAQTLKSEATRLEKEVKDHPDDMLILPDHVDTYRALASKLLLFYTWLQQVSYRFALKTDDDCFLNTRQLVKMYKDYGLHQGSHRNTWLGTCNKHGASSNTCNKCAIDWQPSTQQC